MSGVEIVHVVAKAHLDLGFTDLAAAVERRYLADAFPRAIAVAEELRRRGGPERLAWTTGSWILDRALADEDSTRAAAVAAAVARGDLAWHALPLTTHTELLDVGLVRSGLGISAALDARFGRPTTTAAKLTDVPGHTRGLVPLLAEAGVTFLHLGVNPAWPVPDVPPIFRWRVGEAEVVVAYQAGGYGGEVVVPGCPEALAFLHAGDNLGPPTADAVIAAHAALAARHPGAEIRASTLDAFARALATSGAAADLPVVTAEIGDPWLFGTGGDPQKVAAYRALLAVVAERADRGDSAEVEAARRSLLLVGEHTWGLDQKTWLPDDVRWDRAGLAEVRATAEGRRFESSWAEQRAYLDAAGSALGIDPWAVARIDPGPHGDLGMVASDVAGAGWEARWDLVTGALVGLRHVRSGRVFADPAHPLGLVTYQSFDERDYERFYAGLTPSPDDEWWARWDNTKPGIDRAGAASGRWAPSEARTRFTVPGDDLVVLTLARFDPDLVDRLGAPAEVTTVWTFGADGGIGLELSWDDKAANRLPEAIWCSFVPAVAEPDRWMLHKLGRAVSPLDVVGHGGRALHAVDLDGGCTYDGPDGPLVLETPDAPLVAPGAPRLLDADPPLPDLAGGLHVLLYDNCWGTNFPMWNEGPARFRFRLRPGARTSESG